MYDLALHGTVYSGTLAPKWVYVKDGVIARVATEPVGRAAAAVELERAQLLIPSATDLHVHLRDWSQSEKETVETGSMSALAGGVTAVAEMPNTVPRLETAELVEARADLLGRQSYVDFAIHAAPPVEEREYRRIRRAGAFALKLYPPDLRDFSDTLHRAEASGLKVAVHAEDETTLSTAASGWAEGVAVEKILREMHPHSQVRLAHLSTSGAVKSAMARRKTHRGLTFEVAPHHLFMDRKTANARIGASATVNPQLRSLGNSRAMKRLLLEGRFDFYASDHAPHTPEEKLLGVPGFPGLEIALPLFLTKTENVPLVCRMFCEAPAAYLGLKKGMVIPGHSADLVVLTRRRWKIDPSKFVSRGRVTPFVGEELTYAVDHVFLRGSTVYRDGKFIRHPVWFASGAT